MTDIDNYWPLWRDDINRCLDATTRALAGHSPGSERTGSEYTRILFNQAAILKGIFWLLHAEATEGAK